MDQAAHLRDHISAASTVESTTQRLTTRLKSLQSVTFSTDVPGGLPFAVSNYVVDACSSSDCSNAPFDSALRSINEDKPVLSESLSSAALRIAFYFSELDRAMSEVLESREQVRPDGPPRDPLRAEKELVTSGINQCFFPPDAGRDLSERLVRIRAATSTAFGIQFRISNPAEFAEMTSKFPQTGSNTQMAVMRLEDVAGDIANSSISEKRK